nr:unnamed protein product [Ipomoea trifida]
MAGLQYNFFPTDFFFPRQQAVTKDNAPQQIPLVKVKKISDEIEESIKPKVQPSKAIAINTKAAVSSSSLALAPLQKKHKDQA